MELRIVGKNTIHLVRLADKLNELVLVFLSSLTSIIFWIGSVWLHLPSFDCTRHLFLYICMSFRLSDKSSFHSFRFSLTFLCNFSLIKSTFTYLADGCWLDTQGKTIPLQEQHPEAVWDTPCDTYESKRAYQVSNGDKYDSGFVKTVNQKTNGLFVVCQSHPASQPSQSKRRSSRSLPPHTSQLVCSRSRSTTSSSCSFTGFCTVI